MNNLVNIKGLGAKNISILENIGINNIENLLEYYPYKYNVIKFTNIKQMKDNENVLINANVDSFVLLRRFNSKNNSLSFRCGALGKAVNVIIFNRAYLKSSLTLGRNINVFGKYSESKNTIVASNITFDEITDNTIESVYHLTTGLNAKSMSKYILNAINMHVDMVDYIPSYLINKYEFLGKNESIKLVHFPSTINNLKKARLRLIYEEFFKFMFKINYLKKVNKSQKKTQLRKVSEEDVDNFIRLLPFELTSDQSKVVKEIYDDMNSTYRMNRMLEGDVGSGKTIVAVIAVYINYLSKSQSAFMAPTEILAVQHYENIKNIFIDTPLRVELLLGNTKKSDKDKIYKDLVEGNIDLLIGTHAIISEKVKFKDLGLVITDEQHRFGVKQRASLSLKGNMPDCLYMSATPIPRTFALTLYGEMDISYIKTKPKGRKKIETIIKPFEEMTDVLSLMLDEIKKMHQIYVVCPLIDDNDSNLTNVNELKAKLDIAFNKKVKIDILHGKLSKQDKETIMDNFKEGSTHILISTTVIEVGVDVSNATMMVIFDAERFGLSTLHQLRGRIGRNAYDCKCILIGSNDNERLEVLEESNDGFYISEKDFEMRGEGDLFGVKQSGDMNFKIGNIKDDYKILLQAKEDVIKFIDDNMSTNFSSYDMYLEEINKISSLE